MADTKGQSVIVTGGAGFIGGRLVQALAKEYDVFAFDHSKPEHRHKGVHFVPFDLTSDESVRQAVARVAAGTGGKIASVVHLAAYFDLTGEDDPRYDDITVKGSERLMAALQDLDVGQFVFSSTMLVHKAVRPGQTINESFPLDDRFPYRASKIATEAALKKERGKIPLVIARAAGVYDDDVHNPFLAHQIVRIREHEVIGHLYPGDLSTGQAYLHVDDFCEAIVRMVDRRGNLPDELTLLLGEEKAIGISALQQRIGCLLHGETWKTVEIPAALAKAGARVETDILGIEPFVRPWMVDIANDHYALDISQARQWLNWSPRHDLEADLPKLIDGLKADPLHWYEANRLNTARVAAQAAEAPSSPSSRVMNDHRAVMAKMRTGTLWTQFACIALGLWLALSPLMYDGFTQTQFTDTIWRVTHDRHLMPPADRMRWLAVCDTVSGVLIMLFGSLALSRRFEWAQWANTAVGVWLLFAPVVLWSPSAVVYNNDTLIGALVIAFSILVPMMPGMSHDGMIDETDIPPGWTYSPSTYGQRLPIIALGLFGFIIARYLTSYQLGHTDYIWDPFFGKGTAHIITSDVSKAWPVPDGGVGAISYMFEVLMGIMGSSKRWRTMPWMVLGFGVVVVPLGAVSIFFIIIQPILLGTWCSLCLLAAAAMVIMIPFTLDEVVASCQYLLEVWRRKQSLWRRFFVGGPMPGGTVTQTAQGRQNPFDLTDLVRGWTWQLGLSALIGIGLMFTRLIFHTRPPVADSDHLVGALVFVTAITAMAEVARPVRFLNLAFGAWLVVAPWVLSGASMLAGVSDSLLGIALMALSLPRGRRSGAHYGEWDRFIV